SSIAYQQAHRSRWIAFLRPCDPRDGRERGSSTRCELQKPPAWKLHGVSCLIRSPRRCAGEQRRRHIEAERGHGLQFAADIKPSVIFLTDIRPPGSPAEITSSGTSKAQTGA